MTITGYLAKTSSLCDSFLFVVGLASVGDFVGLTVIIVFMSAMDLSIC